MLVACALVQQLKVGLRVSGGVGLVSFGVRDHRAVPASVFARGGQYTGDEAIAFVRLRRPGSIQTRRQVGALFRKSLQLRI
jgi:hypothetical protein